MVESVALEMRSAGNGTEGSNPSLSSIFSPAAYIPHLFEETTDKRRGHDFGRTPSRYSLPLAASNSV